MIASTWARMTASAMAEAGAETVEVAVDQEAMAVMTVNAVVEAGAEVAGEVPGAGVASVSL